MVTILTIMFVLVCLLLIFMVVITPSQEGGLASAFGGMGSDSFFGTKAQRHVNRFTLFLAVSFLVLAVVINFINARTGPEETKSKLGPQSQPVEESTEDPAPSESNP